MKIILSLAFLMTCSAQAQLSKCHPHDEPCTTYEGYKEYSALCLETQDRTACRNAEILKPYFADRLMRLVERAIAEGNPYACPIEVPRCNSDATISAIRQGIKIHKKPTGPIDPDALIK